MWHCVVQLLGRNILEKTAVLLFRVEEDASIIFLWNIVTDLPNYTASRRRTLYLNTHHYEDLKSHILFIMSATEFPAF
jgi:hypothetical protein